MAKALSWLRNNGVDADDDDIDFGLDKLDTDGLSANSEINRATEAQNALNWLRMRDERTSDIDDGESIKFRKVDAVLPTKKGQSPEDRAKEMENALQWLRSKGLDLDADDTPLEAFDNHGFVPVNLRTGEDDGNVSPDEVVQYSKDTMLGVLFDRTQLNKFPYYSNMLALP